MSTRALVQHDALRGRRLVLETSVTASWSPWKHFLGEWAAAAQGVSDAFQRPTLFVVVSGAPPTALPSADALLSVRHWTGVAAPADLMFYSSLTLRRHQLRPLQQRVAVSVMAHTAAFDPEVVDRLADEPLERILAPSPVLNTMAKERGWYAADLRNGDYPWCLGQSDLVDDQRHVHAAVWAALGRHDEVDHRVWTGQVGVLLPFVEERRRELLQEIRRLWPAVSRLPDGKGGAVENLYDLEIGHLFAIRETLRQKLRAKWLSSISPLRDIRNHIAHLEVVPPQLLESPAIMQIEHGYQ
jgi:hypothetical protein